MGKYNFAEIIDRSGTESLKYDAGRIYNPDLPEDYIPMWVADMDLACPQPMLDAMHERLNRRILGYANYPSTMGDNYYEAVSGWVKRRHNIIEGAHQLLLQCYRLRPGCSGHHVQGRRPGHDHHSQLSLSVQPHY